VSDAPCLTDIRLTDKDFAVLDAMLVRRAALGDPLAALIEEKLEEAVVVSSEEIGAGVATLNSRVAFRIDALAPEERTLVRHEGRGAVGRGLPIDTRRGLAILGMSEGQTVRVERRGGGFERVSLEKVLYQPEAARRSVRASAQSARPALVLVHDAGSDWQPLGGPAKIRQGWNGDDDPGPSAA
jgi:regulator of nucleoside diphosphate kinase